MNEIKPAYIFPLAWIRFFFIVFDAWVLLGALLYFIGKSSVESEEFEVILNFILSECSGVLIHALWIGLLISILIPIAIIRPYYSGSVFIFEKNKFVYKHKFISTTHRETDFKNVKEVVLKQGPLQRIFGVGTIHLLTHATPYQTGMTSGLKLFDVKNPDEVHQKIKELIG